MVTVSCLKDGAMSFNRVTIGNRSAYDVVLPLIDADMDMGYALSSVQMTRTDDDGLLHLIYEDEFTFNALSLDIDLPTQYLTFDAYSITIPRYTEMGDSIIFTYPMETQLGKRSDGLGGADSVYYEFDTISLLAGQLDFFINPGSSMLSGYKVKITSNDVIDENGNDLELYMEAPSSTFGGQTAQTTVSLAGYRICSDRFDIRGVNYVDFTVELTAMAFRYFAAPQNVTINMNCKFEDLQTKTLSGYIVDTTAIQPIAFQLNGGQTGLFKRFMDRTSLELDKVLMSLSFSNSFQLPIFVTGALHVYSNDLSATSDSLAIETDIPYPIKVGEKTYADTTFSKEIQHLVNGNTAYTIDNADYFFNVICNRGNDRTIRNVISYDDDVRFAFTMDIPMRLSLGGLVLMDTFNFSGLPQAEGIELFILKANIHNGFPFEASMMLYLLDSDSAVLDSITMASLKGAEVDRATGHVIRKVISQTEIVMHKEQIEHLVNTRLMVVKSVLNTSDYKNQMVNIYQDEFEEGHLRLQLGARMKASADIVAQMINLNFSLGK
ncbi:hypothetical protein FACS1894201_02560 [Bacteroidia bacterium]|nr:hypothetical protein FACS1894201_02560 [Bacteroidia bacterium]